jgi:hypothetical protein
VSTLLYVLVIIITHYWEGECLFLFFLLFYAVTAIADNCRKMKRRKGWMLDGFSLLLFCFILSTILMVHKEIFYASSHQLIPAVKFMHNFCANAKKKEFQLWRKNEITINWHWHWQSKKLKSDQLRLELEREEGNKRWGRRKKEISNK